MRRAPPVRRAGGSPARWAAAARAPPPSACGRARRPDTGRDAPRRARARRAAPRAGPPSRLSVPARRRSSGRIVPNARSGREGCLRRGKQSARAALEGQLLQPVDGAGKPRREPERAQALRVVPPIRRELLEEIGLEARRRDRGLPAESQPPAARDPPVEWTPEDPIGQALREPEPDPRRPRGIREPPRLARPGRLEDGARQLLQR